MFMSTVEAAQELGMSSRQVRRLVEAGHLRAERVGANLAIYDKYVFAYQNRRSHGRKWLDVTRLAALDMLSSGDSSRVSASEKSRLKSRIKKTEIQALAKQLLGSSAELYDGKLNNEFFRDSLEQNFGLTGEGTNVLVSVNSRRNAATRRLSRNPNGRIVVVEGEPGHRQVLEAVSLFVFGDARERMAASEWLEQSRKSL